jgi:hypothetical protein
MRVINSHALIATIATACIFSGGAVAQQQARVIRPADLPPSFRQRLSRGEVARVSPAGVDTVRQAPQVVLRPGEVLATRTGEVATAVPRQPGRDSAAGPRDSVYRLPFTYVGLDRVGAAPMVYRPVYVPEGPLRYSTKEDRFVGSFLLGLQDSVHPRDAQELGSPVRIRFGGDADSTAPDSVVLRVTNSQMERVRVFTSSALDSVRVVIVPAFDPRGVGVWLPIQPALAFEQTPGRIQGFGVEGATLVIGTRGVRSRDSFPVILSIDRGSLEANQIFVSSGGGVVKLRSAGLGLATVSARAPGWLPVQTTIRYQWPLIFLTAALLGGALGGVVASVQGRRRSRSSVLRFVTRGILVGLVVCVVYFGIGINLLQFQVDVRFFNEIAVFALAALAAMFGIPALSALSKRGDGG